MKVSDERLAKLLDSYTWLSSHPSHSGRNDRARSGAEHASIIKELQDYRSSGRELAPASQPLPSKGDGE